MSALAESLASVRARVEAACQRSGRQPGSVELVAVSKRQPAELIREAYALGQRHFGENYAQELRDKAMELAGLEGLQWHAIGPLQGNKARYVARAAAVFHALDRESLAAQLSSLRSAGGAPPLRCYLEIKLADEDSKSGVPPEQAKALLAACRGLPGLEPIGLMGLPPLSESAEGSRPFFRRLRELALQLGLPGLSMGTTHDFEVAIEEGATSVRVGTALFGERPARQG